MTPYEQARKVYETEPCVRTFEEDLHLHLIYGYVFSNPESFVMYRPVFHAAPEHQIVDPAYVFPPESIDCWHIYLAAGKFKWDERWFPHDLKYFSFERKNRLRFRSFHKMKRVLCHSQNSTARTSPPT